MPYLTVNGYQIYYRVKGDGVPMLLLEGLGYASWMWKYQVPEFIRWSKVIMPDNRGVGNSTKLTGPYTIEEFANDAISVVNSLSVEKFYVLGVSMGGLIAQSIVNIIPNRVKGVILVSTTCGGPKAIPMFKETFEQMQLNLEGETIENKIRRTMKLALTQSFPITEESEFNEIIKERMKYLQTNDQLLYQSLSSVNFDNSTKNNTVTIPSLIVAGTEDRVLPYLNSIILYKSLPRSSLLLFKGQNHLLFMEKYGQFNRFVYDFVSSIENGSFSEYVEEVI
ncbi:MAG: alpha/beta hydrolase [Nitrososphaeria archaeon]